MCFHLLGSKMNLPIDDCEITEVHQLSKRKLQLQRIKSHEKQKTKRIKLLKNLNFSCKFLEDIRNGKWLNDSHIKTVSDLLIHQFPMIPGLYDPKYGEDLSFPPTDDGFVQILHYKDHWLTIHGITCESVKVYDILNSTVSLQIQARKASIVRCQSPSIILEVHDTQLQI